MSDFDVLIVGGGPAAITIAKTAGKSMNIGVIRPEDHSLIYCAMPYVIEGHVELERTFKKDALVTDSGAVLIRGLVEKVDLQNRFVLLADGKNISFTKLVIATGAVPFIPPIPGSNLNGVTGFKTEHDLKYILNQIAYGLKKAVIVGAGAIGVELSLALKKAGLTVDLVDMGDSILPNLLDPEMAQDIETEIIRQGINIHLKSKVIAITGKDSAKSVELDNGRKIYFETGDNCTTPEIKSPGIVVFATGMKPVVDLFQNTGLEIGKDGIIVNEKMETNIKNVYAAGDCVQFVSGISKTVVSGKLATNAVPMAKVIADNLLGKSRTYKGFYNGAATKTGNFFAGGTGFTQSACRRIGIDFVTGYSEVTTCFPILPEASRLKVKLIAQSSTGKIIGGQVISGEPVTGLIDLITYAIQKNSTVDDILDLSYSSQPYQSFYPAGNGLVMAAEDISKKITL